MGLVPYKRGSIEIPSLFHPVRIPQEGAGYDPESGPLPSCARAMILYFPALKTVRNKHLLLLNHSVYSICYGSQKGLREAANGCQRMGAPWSGQVVYTRACSMPGAACQKTHRFPQAEPMTEP